MALLSRPAALPNFFNCALAAAAQACGAGALLLFAAVLLTRSGAGPGPGAAAAAAGSARVSGLLVLAVLVCFWGGQIAAALGGSRDVWALAWALLFTAHVALHVGFAPAAARFVYGKSHASQIAIWVFAACVWPLVASVLAFGAGRLG